MPEIENIKIWLVTSRFQNGGLERVLLNLGQEFLNRKISTTIISGKVDNSFCNHSSTLRITEITKYRFLFFPCFLFKVLKDRPSHIITTSNDTACFAIFLKKLFFQKFHIAVSQHLAIYEPIKKAKIFKKIKLIFIKEMMRLLYPLADSIISVSKGVAHDMIEHLKIDHSKITVIYNPIINDQLKDKIKYPSVSLWQDTDVPIIAFVGRLEPVKRLDLLLDAFELVLKKHPVHLLIIGSGPEEDWITQEIDKKRWNNIIYLTGFCDNIFPFLKKTCLLVLPSDYEGFGNVLVEAMSCGIQVVATNCPSGPSEILDNGIFGQLVPTGNSWALAEAILNVVMGKFYVSPETLKNRANFFSSQRAADLYLKALLNE